MRILYGIIRIYSILVRINIHILQPLSPRPHLLRRVTTVSRTPLVAASDSHTRRSHTHVPRPASRPCDALVPPVYPQRACLRAARYRQTSLADRHIQDTAAHDPGDQLRVLWPQKYHHTRASVGYCKGISASTCQRRAHECATQPCGKPSPRSANPNPTCLRDSTSGRPRVGAGGLFPYPVTHGPRLVPV